MAGEMDPDDPDMKRREVIGIFFGILALMLLVTYWFIAHSGMLGNW
jgi:hypothetical protein